jgi:HTH-type transcriptional regulator/antitoxin HigA
MNNIKLIKKETEYNHALERIEQLMETAVPGTPEGDMLELLVTLVEIYEKENYPVPPPSSIEAIKFRMDQMGMTQRDLIPILGSRSRVSEVLSGKRPLTLAMIRALRKHLDIPAETLLQASGELPQEPKGIQWERYPLKEMVKRGWFPEIKRWSKGLWAVAEDLIHRAAEQAGDSQLCEPSACYRAGTRKNAKADPYALQAWILGVKMKAQKIDRSILPRFDPNTLSMDFLRNVSKLSVLSQGPKLAQELLASHGIILVVVPHFDKTYLDGAAMLLEDGTPVIGLTLRHDRIDYFWFCLLHELAHVWKHLRPEDTDLVLDDLDIVLDHGIEKEADSIAREAEIPEEKWNKHLVHRTGSVEHVRDFAQSLGIHPAIVAGRVRFLRGDYRILSKMVGHKMVRPLFKEEFPNP